MDTPIKIYGKDTCPFTTAAREAYEKQGRTVHYINVLANPLELDIMLKLSNGRRQVPVIVEGDAITIGFRGKA